MWLIWEGMDRGEITRSDKRTHTHRALLRHAATIWFDCPCCSLDLPYFNCWRLHTVKSKLSWPRNAGVFWGPFAGRTRDLLRSCPCPNVSKLENPSFCFHFGLPSTEVGVFVLSETDEVEHKCLDLILMREKLTFLKNVIQALAINPKWLSAEFVVHPFMVNNCSKTVERSLVEMT